jgi:hypothetical protein
LSWPPGDRGATGGEGLRRDPGSTNRPGFGAPGSFAEPF